jgi:hypothetical protein
MKRAPIGRCRPSEPRSRVWLRSRLSSDATDCYSCRPTGGIALDARVALTLERRSQHARLRSLHMCVNPPESMPLPLRGLTPRCFTSKIRSSTLR